MAESENYVSWDAVLHIWLAQIRRIAAVDIALYLAFKAMSWLTPVFFRAIMDFNRHFEDLSYSIVAVMQVLILLWAFRESLVDRYAGFTLAVEHKESRRSLFGFGHRLPWHIVLAAWWAQVWRMLLVPGALLGGCLAGMIKQHPHVSGYSHLLNPMFLRFDLYALLVFSFWATRESLGDKYRIFRFVTTPKSLYAKKGPLQ